MAEKKDVKKPMAATDFNNNGVFKVHHADSMEEAVKKMNEKKIVGEKSSALGKK